MTTHEPNSIRASLQFYFKGEPFSPTTTIDLDRFMLRGQSYASIYDMLAASIGIDSYRHEYDVMILEEISFSDATGTAREFLTGHTFDFDAFSKAWERQNSIRIVTPIAQSLLGIEAHPDMLEALLACFQAGKLHALKSSTPTDFNPLP